MEFLHLLYGFYYDFRRIHISRLFHFLLNFSSFFLVELTSLWSRLLFSLLQFPYLRLIRLIRLIKLIKLIRPFGLILFIRLIIRLIDFVLIIAITVDIILCSEFENINSELLDNFHIEQGHPLPYSIRLILKNRIEFKGHLCQYRLLIII